MNTLRLMPEYRLELGGAPAPEELRRSIGAVRFSSGLEAADRVELSVHDPKLVWLEHPLLAMGERLALALGYASEGTKQVFVGKVVTVAAAFPSTGAVTLTVAAQDARSEMQHAVRTRFFAIPGAGQSALPLPDAVVAPAVVAAHGLIPVMDPIALGVSALLGAAEIAMASSEDGAVQKLIRRQDGQSDFDFLRTIAAENGWEIVVDHDEPLGGQKVRFLSAASELTPIAQFEYGRNLLDFQPRVTSIGQVARVTARFWVAELKTELAASVGYDWDRGELTLQLSPTTVGGAPTDTVGPALELAGKQANPHNVARLLLGELLPRLNRRLTATATVVGSPALRAGVVVEIAGTGRFSGRYRVVDAAHSIDAGGYLTALSLRREIWFDTPSLGPPNVSFSV